MTLRALSSGVDGEFVVDQEVFARPSIRLQFKATKSGNYLEYAGRNAINSVFDLIDFKKALGPFGLGWGYMDTYFSEETGRVHATKISEMGIEIAKFTRNLGNRLLDIAWSEDKRAAVSYGEPVQPGRVGVEQDGLLYHNLLTVDRQAMIAPGGVFGPEMEFASKPWAV